MPEDFQRFDRIYAMAGDVLQDIRRIARHQFNPGQVDLLLNERYPGQNLDVPDPWYGPEAGYHKVYELIDSACEAILDRYGRKRSGHPEGSS